MATKVIVTGSDGFIGKPLVKELQRLNYAVKEIDHANGSKGIIDLTFSDLDGFDAIIHLAAHTDVQESFDYTSDYLYNNVVGTAQIAQLAQESDTKLVFISSAAVYDRESSPYALSKYLADLYVQGMMRDMDATILRLFNIYSLDEIKEGTMVDHFLHDDPIQVHGGGQTRSFVPMHYVVTIIKEALKNKWNKQVVDVGSSETYTITQIAQWFAEARGVGVKYGGPLDEVQESKPDLALLHKLYKPDNNFNFKSDIQKLVKAHK